MNNVLHTCISGYYKSHVRSILYIIPLTYIINNEAYHCHLRRHNKRIISVGSSLSIIKCRWFFGIYSPLFIDHRKISVILKNRYLRKGD